MLTVLKKPIITDFNSQSPDQLKSFIGQYQEVPNTSNDSVLAEVAKTVSEEEGQPAYVFQEILNSLPAYKLLDSAVPEGVTWTSGGCLILAQALQMLIGGSIIVAFDYKKDIKQHYAFLTEQGQIIDYDGVFENRYDWIDQFAEKESLNSADLMAGELKGSIIDKNVVSSWTTSMKLSKMLRKGFKL